MKKKKMFRMMIIFCSLMVGLSIFFLQNNFENERLSHEKVDKVIQSGNQEIDKTKYTNLCFKSFEVKTDTIEGVYNIEIISNNSYQERTFLENFKIMNEVIDEFFKEDFDKSNIVADFYLDDQEVTYVNYYDIEKICQDEKYNTSDNNYLFGNNTSDGGYMVQIDEGMMNVWFSKNGLGTIMPSQLEYQKVCIYLSGVRQVEDIEVNLIDKKVKLSELEEEVIKFLNEEFPMKVSQNISFGIADARILSNGEYDGVCFKVRRFYKGIPFEYGSNFATDMYIDEYENDRAEVSYSVSNVPDSMLSFGKVNGTVVETQKITEMITMDEAIQILSDNIGENSVYDVYGIELVYRQCIIPETRQGQVDAILKPCWKMITVNQNDDKYTLFYVDVVTGEITDRFEYYYE